MKKIVLAIVSDLHVGRHARSADLCPHPDGVPAVRDKYREAFLTFLKDAKIVADYLIVPGDVSETADFAEVELASSFLIEVANTLKVKTKCILFVPGNHDIDWKVLDGTPNPVRWAQRYDPIKYKHHLFRKVMGCGTLLEPPFVSKWQFNNLVVVGYNSSWHDKPKELIHHGRIEASHLKAINDALDTIDKSSHLVRLFLVHHHPVAYDAPVPGPADFSQMINCEELFKLLRNNYVDLVIHGHTHQPRFHTIQAESALPIAILAAGSFSLQLPMEWQGKINNQFHLLTIDDRDADLKCIRGNLQSWTYYFGHGWRPSTHATEGIGHSEPFGSYLGPHDCRALLRATLETAFLKKEWLNRDDLVAVCPALNYMRPERLMLALTELATTMGFTIHDAAPDKLLLLK